MTPEAEDAAQMRRAMQWLKHELDVARRRENIRVREELCSLIGLQPWSSWKQVAVHILKLKAKGEKHR